MSRYHRALVVLFVVFCPAGILNARYFLTELGDFPGGDNYSSGGSINAIGQVTGISYAASGPRSFLWTPTTPNGVTGSIVDIGDLPGGVGRVTPSGGINSAGQVAGRSDAAMGQNRGYLWTPETPNGSVGSMVNIGNLPGRASTRASGINDFGQVAGIGFGPERDHPLLWTPSTAGASSGSMIDLGLLPGGTMFGGALGMNSRGQVVGYSDTAALDHAFLWNPDAPNGTTGSMFDLGVLPDMNFSLAYGINELGQVTGYTGNNSTLEFRGFLWQPTTPNGSIGTMFDLGSLPGVSALPLASDINSHGVIVGTMRETGFPADPITAFVWIPDTTNGTVGIIHDLHDLLFPDVAQYWTSLSASSINDRGQIAGFGLFDADGPSGASAVTRAFLLTPTVPEPSAAYLLSIGLCLKYYLSRPRYFPARCTISTASPVAASPSRGNDPMAKGRRNSCARFRPQSV